MKKKIDARGLACPKPLILTRQALGLNELDAIEVEVDNEAALENVLRFLRKSGWRIIAAEGFIIHAVSGSDSGIAGTTETKKPASGQIAGQAGPQHAGNEAATLFISSEYMGTGDPELGNLLMRGFVYSLTEIQELPERIILMNSGVKLAVEGSKVLDDLHKIESSGTEIIVCGTCLDFYGLMESRAVGIVSNMYTITEHLLEDGNVVKIC